MSTLDYIPQDNGLAPVKPREYTAHDVKRSLGSWARNGKEDNNLPPGVLLVGNLSQFT